MMFASPETDYRSWDYLTGDLHRGTSIGVIRYQWLFELASLQPDLVLALKDPAPNSETAEWTRHRGFYTTTWDCPGWSPMTLQAAYDVHRSMLDNEVVVESDLLCNDCTMKKTRQEKTVIGCPDCYARNLESTQFIGRLLEARGYVPSYYYSGSKSIHCHVFLDFGGMTIDYGTRERLRRDYASYATFRRDFMKWLRELVISCFGTKARTYDENFTKPKQMIRAELSRNKAGYKTFLGHKAADLPFLPSVRNEENGKQPELGPMVLSVPHDAQELVEEFLVRKEEQAQVIRKSRQNASILHYLAPEQNTGVKLCIQSLLEGALQGKGDGYRRAAFFIACELRRVYGPGKALEELREWNARLGGHVRDDELRYLVERKDEYTIGHARVHEFLSGLGVPVVCQWT